MKKVLKAIFKLNIVKAIAMLAIISGGLASCTYYTNEFDPTVVPDGVSFETDIVPIFEASCNAAGCHNGSIPPDLRAEAAYVNLVGLGYVVPGTPAEDNGLYQSIDGGSMEAYASDLERAYIKKWLDEGAENN
jgi:hypothetical protein